MLINICIKIRCAISSKICGDSNNEEIKGNCNIRYCNNQRLTRLSAIMQGGEE